ncbi:MAG TPA: TM2 domain-containing protein [Bacteroidales bacterium]|nr:TM2 domain-containing protein [Bacteroidales bacterium]HOX78539.1 TM2 domain-containing protein [Bacteroidales bacterium]HPI86841.1 TM2 domain-containing protein [Bacteroidales bacterium]
MSNLFQYLPELQGRELVYVQGLVKDYTDNQLMNFANIYRSRRRDPQIILLTGLLGFVGISGVQRFLVNQIGMGILYLFTAGLCFIGTIIDLINYQDLAMEYNMNQANEAAMLVKNL